MFIKNLAYEASAGSGKTFMLVVRYLSLLFQGADPSKILALTFTNKAALEMSQRVVETLEDLENRGELLEIAKVTEIPVDKLIQKKVIILEEFLNANTKIMTIDSFFTQILRKFSLYSSLMPDFSTFASQHELKLMSRFLVEVRAANKQKTLIDLSIASKKRLSDLFTLLDDFYIKKEELKSFTFVPTDIKEPIQKAQNAFEKLKSLVYSCDGASKTALKSVEAKSFEEICAKTWIGRETLDYRTFSKCYIPEMDIYLHKIQEAIAAYYRAKEQNFFSALLDLSTLYKKSKKALYQDESELSFNDVTALVYEILHLLDDSEFLYFRLDAKIEHMLLDEFQDTSVLQYAILRPLIKEITSGNGIFDEGSFFFVGDVKQSIYRFRGGVSALFDEVAKDNNTQVEKLVTNYRSQKEVVSFVNDVFIDKINNYTPQLVREGVDGGYVEVLESEELIDETLTQVQRLIDEGVDLNDIAILCATNGDGEEIKLQLQAQKIEVVTETTTKLIAQKSVKALIEYLKYIYFQEDIYRYNFFALIDHELESLAFVDLNRVKLIDIVKNIINEYGLFENEFHLVRFMDLIVNYKDIEAFLFEYERIDAAAAASDLQGVRVLTIHKSKGLEYEHVIVLDRLKRKPAPRDAIIYEYDGIVLKNIYLRSKSREELDTAYANAIAKEKELVKEDTSMLCMLHLQEQENICLSLKK
jgi:exodeoxyribonuclease V beta subunit